MYFFNEKKKRQNPNRFNSGRVKGKQMRSPQVRVDKDGNDVVNRLDLQTTFGGYDANGIGGEPIMVNCTGSFGTVSSLGNKGNFYGISWRYHGGKKAKRVCKMPAGKVEQIYDRGRIELFLLVRKKINRLICTANSLISNGKVVNFDFRFYVDLMDTLTAHLKQHFPKHSQVLGLEKADWQQERSIMGNPGKWTPEKFQQSVRGEKRNIDAILNNMRAGEKIVVGQK